MAAWFHGGKGLNVAAGSATNDQACDYIAAPSISAQKPPPLPVHESQIRATPPRFL